MAIVTGIINETTRKGLDGICFQHYNGQTIMRSKPLHYTDAKTPAQLVQRQRMKNLGFIYKYLKDKEVLFYSDVRKNGKKLETTQAFQFINASKVSIDHEVTFNSLYNDLTGIVTSSSNIYDLYCERGAPRNLIIDLSAAQGLVQPNDELYIKRIDSVMDLHGLYHIITYQNIIDGEIDISFMEPINAPPSIWILTAFRNSNQPVSNFIITKS